MTKIELLIVIGVILFLLTLLVPPLMRARESNRRTQCASNLRRIGQAILLYSNDQRGGAFPRTNASVGPNRVPTWGTSPGATQPFTATGPLDNDVAAALFMLLRTQDITPQVFVCPSTNATPDDLAGLPAKQRSNFSNLRLNLTYSYNNPYPNDFAIGRGYGSSFMGAEFALAADMNPGTKGAGDNVFASMSLPNKMNSGNSNNHNKIGQNVLYGDGHVEWELSPLVGNNDDNIYTTADGRIAASPYDGNDSILLPTDD